MTTAAYDLVLEGGRVLDPGSGIDDVMDVAVSGGRVVAIGTGLGANASQRLACAGMVVTPGLIDCHTHVFAHVSKVGAPVEEAHLYRGVVACADAGTAGASTFEAFRRYVAESTKMRVLSFLNVSVLGLIDFRFGELLNPATLVSEDAIEVAKQYPGIVRGLKIRLSTDVVGQECLALLDVAVATGERAGLPLLVHIGETAATLAEILDHLRPGDMVAHCYTGKPDGILDENGKVSAEVWAARERGVLFECAHGKTNFSYAVARPAIAEGFLPDFVCSDTSYRNWNGPVFDMLTTMSKLATLGMALPDIVERATIAPAKKLGLWDEGFGRIEVGQPAHLSVFELLPGTESVPDGSKAMLDVQRYDARWTIIDGEIVEALPWRGDQPSQS